ncbi:hypothetical protein C2S51_035418 [Perilla frutescens var. frutescens]|nr:hypothetical protein C2S51_035418 [Perilla frutescens var. frutescens]
MDGSTNSSGVFPPADSENAHQLECSNKIPAEERVSHTHRNRFQWNMRCSNRGAPECRSLQSVDKPISDYQRNRLAALKMAKAELEAAIRGQNAIVEDISEILRRKEAELAAVKARVEALHTCKAELRSEEVILKAVVNNLCLCYAVAQLTRRQM